MHGPPVLRRLFESLQRRLGLEPQEGRLLALMGALVAILLCAYTIAKVLRDALFLQEFGALSLPFAYIGVALTAAGYVWIESRVARRFTHVGASRFNQYAAIGCSVVAALALGRARHWTAGLFYLWTGSQAMMLLPHFWGLALDVWNSRRARRIFPLLSGCGLLGGLLGGGFAAWTASFLPDVVLMWILAGLLVLARALSGLIERHHAPVSQAEAATASSLSRWEIIRKSGYIKVLTAGLALSVIVATLVDFQFKLFVQRTYPAPHDLTQFLGAFYAGLNALSLLFQFGVAGWLLHRLGLGASTSLQPGAVLVFATWAAMTTGGWAVVAMRWIQGIVSQTLGKPSTEIYYAAIRPNERRRIKPALDTLVERWSDALVGVVLLVVLHLLRVPVATIMAGTAAVAAAWLVVLFLLNGKYGRAFQEALSRGWIEPDEAPESMRLPAARQALQSALGSDDERQVLLALKLSRFSRDAETAGAVMRCLRHPSPAVRAGAVETMEALELPDPDRLIEGFLPEPHEGLRRAAVAYRLAMGPQSIAFARRLLDGDDVALRRYLLDALADHPYEGQRQLTQEWIDARIRSGGREDLLAAAQALRALGGTTGGRLRTLLASRDVDVQRAALLAAARRPSHELLEALLPLLVVPDLDPEARNAVAAIGDTAVPALRRLLEGGKGERAQSRAAAVLAQIASPIAIEGLMSLVRSSDLRLRHFGLQGMTRVRYRAGRPVLPRELSHRLFHRELRDYRVWRAPVADLEKHEAPEVRLLGEGFQESADWALERAFQALACWYEPRPLSGVLSRLKSRDLAVSSPALEYLGHVLPRAAFKPVSRVFEREAIQTQGTAPARDPLDESIRLAWETGDAWLRACAVRASRHVPGFDRGRFAAGDEGNPMVRAELESLSGEGEVRTAPETHSC